jgi:hypothetical protein
VNSDGEAGPAGVGQAGVGAAGVGAGCIGAADAWQRGGRPGRGRRRRAVFGFGIGGAALTVAAAAFQAGQQPRYEGEHGLAVHHDGDSVIVRWLTSASRPGYLEVLSEESVVARATTAAGFAHRAAFLLPAGAGEELLLQYGAEPGAGNRFETMISLRSPERPAVVFEPADSIFVIGDTHGMYDEFLAGMRYAGLIDAGGRWIGGRRHLVLAGDLMDRGPDVGALLWSVYRLEREAAAAGGRVHVLLGNHEIMVMMGDLRYVHPKEAEVAQWHGVAYDRLYDVRNSLIGRWLATKPGIVRIGGAAIVHGGLAPEYARPGLRAIDDSLNVYMGEDLFYLWADTTAVLAPMDSLAYVRRRDFFWAPRSLFWHRGYVQTDTLGAELDEALAAIDASLLIVGHTAVDTIEARYGGRVLAAHTPRFGAELTLLVRDGDGYRRYRVTESGAEPVVARPAGAGGGG